MTSYYKSHVLSTVLTASITSFIGGYQIGVFNPSQDNVAYSYGWTGSEKTSMISICSTLLPIGAIIGSALSGKFARSLGRRQALLVLAYIIILGCVINVLPSTLAFALGRFIEGITTGLATITSMYIAEVAPKEVSGSYGSMVQLSICFGIFVAYCFGIPLPSSDFESSWNNLWYLEFLLPIVFAAVQVGLLMYVHTYDTPKWLLEKGRTNEALLALEQIYTKDRARMELKLLDKRDRGINDSSSDHSDDALIGNSSPIIETSYKDLLRPPHLRPFIIGCSLSIIQQFSAINVIIFYSTAIFKDLGEASTIHYMTALQGFVNFVSVFIGLMLADKLSRRTMLLQGYVGMTVLLFIMGYCSYSDADPVITVIFILIFMASFESSVGVILWVYLSETMVDKAIGIAIAVSWITAGVG